MSKPKLLISLTVILTLLLIAPGAAAEAKVQQSWQCQAGTVMVVSNTPCQDGAQAVSGATSVIYHCLRNGVSSFQQTPCAARDSRVHLYSDVRTPDDIVSGQRAHATWVGMAKTAHAAQMRREKSRGVTVIGQSSSSGRTGGDGKADGYRKPNRSTGGGSGY